MAKEEISERQRRFRNGVSNLVESIGCHEELTRRETTDQEVIQGKGFREFVDGMERRDLDDALGYLEGRSKRSLVASLAAPPVFGLAAKAVMGMASYFGWVDYAVGTDEMVDNLIPMMGAYAGFIVCMQGIGRATIYNQVDGVLRSEFEKKHEDD